MKSVFLSILCSILLSNICFTMDKSHSISTENLVGWDTLEDDIQLAQPTQSTQNNKKSLSWFPIINAVRRSIYKNPTPLVSISKPETKTVTTAPALGATIIPTQAVIANPIPSVAVQREEQQCIDATTRFNALSVKKSTSHEKLSEHNNSDDITQADNKNMNLQDLSMASMSIDRDSENSRQEDLIKKQISPFVMFQQVCCNCLNMCQDLESKKKNNK